MRKTIIALLLVAAASLMSAVSDCAVISANAAAGAAVAVAAATEEYLFGGDGKLPYVADMALCLTDPQTRELGERAEAISNGYQCEIRVITVGDMRDYGYKDIELFSLAIYDQYAMGYGPDRSCLTLILSMDDRDYDLRAWGYGTKAFTFYGIDTMLDRHVLPLLKDNQYYKAFSKYLDKAEEYLKLAGEGDPFDKKNDREFDRDAFIAKLCVTIIVPVLIALAVCLIWRAQMKTAKVARTADDYIPENGFNLTRRDDIYLYRTVTRRKIETSSSGGGGGGGARSGGGGSSGRSGKF